MDWGEGDGACLQAVCSSGGAGRGYLEHLFGAVRGGAQGRIGSGEAAMRRLFGEWCWPAGRRGRRCRGGAKSVEAVTIPPRYAGCPRLRIVSTRVLKPPGTGWTSSSGAGWTGFVKGAVAGVNGAAGRLSASGISFDCQIHNFRAVACRAEGLLLGVSERGLSRGDAGRVSKGCRVHDLELSLAAGGVVPSPEGVRALG